LDPSVHQSTARLSEAIDIATALLQAGAVVTAGMVSAVADLADTIQRQQQQQLAPAAADNCAAASAHLLHAVSAAEAIRRECQDSTDSAYNKGFTPLHFAARSKRPGAVSRLLAEGADVSVTCSRGSTALHEAISCFDGSPESLEVVRLLLDAASRAGCINWPFARPLLAAAITTASRKAQGATVVRMLLAHGAIPNASVGAGAGRPWLMLWAMSRAAAATLQVQQSPNSAKSTARLCLLCFKQAQTLQTARTPS
jgi:ankyrin repeat protein